jgi:Domain of unknown function (DUF1998)
MSSGFVRRAQLVSPFGVGAMTVVPNGTSLVAAGLDHWYEREDTGDDSRSIDLDEFRLEEWRLQAELRVSQFRLPPDWRTKKGYGGEVPNLRLPVPYQRFPMWNFCPRCSLLQPLPLSTRGKAHCTDSQHLARGSGKGPFVVQVPFVAICDYGHLQDFPWREWVHHSLAPSCAQPMRLRSTGGASLSAQMVDCECGRSRNLAGITEAAPIGSSEYPSTTLSSELTGDGDEYLCPGAMPWHGEQGGRGCGRPIRGSLRAASNLYYALVKSSIYLPRSTGTVPEKLILALDTPPLSTLIIQLRQLGALDQLEPEFLRGQQREILQPYDDRAIRDALNIIRETTEESRIQTIENVANDENDATNLSDDTEFRRPEFEVLRHKLRTPFLEIHSADLTMYDLRITPFFSRLMLIDKLRETRALYGFNRIFPENDLRLADRKALLWRRPPVWSGSWLPAYVVHGEGIFLELDESKLTAWESMAKVQARVSRLASNYASVRRARKLRNRELTPRFVLLHTLAHLLMNQLTFECGYSSAALRERLYVSGSPRPMAGVLLYTAAGDAEGTMGGLVRMGKAGYFEPALMDAMDSARWCSADPVCMEIGEAGQGPDSCNMAACHCCALVPETACEEFNRFLDRGLVVGTLRDPELGLMRF